MAHVVRRRTTRSGAVATLAVVGPAVTVERRLEQPPVTVRSTLEPLGDGRVRIVRYERRRARAARFERVRTMENRVVAFEQLGLDVSYFDVFPQGGLFDGLERLA